jgi:hypothetical protein
LPSDGGYRDCTEHLVGGLHQPDFLKVKGDERNVGHLDASAVWHFQNDAKLKRHFYKRAAAANRTPASAAENDGPIRVGGI